MTGRVGHLLHTAALTGRGAGDGQWVTGVRVRAAQIPGADIPEDARLYEHPPQFGHQVMPEQHRVVGVHHQREVQPAASARAQHRDGQALFDGSADSQFLVEFQIDVVAVGLPSARAPAQRTQRPHQGQRIPQRRGAADADQVDAVARRTGRVRHIGGVVELLGRLGSRPARTCRGGLGQRRGIEGLFVGVRQGPYVRDSRATDARRQPEDVRQLLGSGSLAGLVQSAEQILDHASGPVSRCSTVFRKPVRSSGADHAPFSRSCTALRSWSVARSPSVRRAMKSSMRSW